MTTDREVEEALRRLERKAPRKGGEGPYSYNAPARDPGCIYWKGGNAA